MDTKNIGLWSFFLGTVLAIATAFVDLGDWAAQVLIVLGLLAGFFHQKIKEELVSFGVIYLGLLATTGSMTELIAVGPIITDIASAWVGFLGPVLLTAFMVWGGAFITVNKGGE